MAINLELNMAILAGVLGGIGLFLLGMSLMTDGLKTLGGASLKRILSRLTGGPFKAFLTGAGITALVHSSAATVVTTIGFVSAGLLTFHQAIAIVIGANVGTTSTGWLVAVLGLNFSIQIVALPLIGLGAFLKMFGGERTEPVGLVMAGFGLIFVGIDFLQTGLSEVSYNFDYASIATDTFSTRGLLVISGIVTTIILQSSSVAVAMTITALHTGGISFDQAAALVIGQNVGTAATSLLAVIGATVPARRTAVAHMGFNVITGLLVFLFFPLFSSLFQQVCSAIGLEQASFQLAAFHTFFNLTGVLILLPVSGRFARLIEHLLPEKGPEITRYLDVSVASVPAVAVDAARRTMIDVYVHIVQLMDETIRTEPAKREIEVESENLQRSIEETRNFLRNIKSVPDRTEAYHQHLMILLAIDHLESILIRKLENVPFHRLAEVEQLEPVLVEIRRHLAMLKTMGPHRFDDDTARDVEAFSHQMAEIRREKRLELIQMAAAGNMEPDAAQDLIEDLRWVDSLFFHLWKVRIHLSEKGTTPA